MEVYCEKSGEKIFLGGPRHRSGDNIQKYS